MMYFWSRNDTRTVTVHSLRRFYLDIGATLSALPNARCEGCNEDSARHTCALRHSGGLPCFPCNALKGNPSTAGPEGKRQGRESLTASRACSTWGFLCWFLRCYSSFACRSGNTPRFVDCPRSAALYSAASSSAAWILPLPSPHPTRNITKALHCLAHQFFIVQVQQRRFDAILATLPRRDFLRRRLESKHAAHEVVVASANSTNRMFSSGTSRSFVTKGLPSAARSVICSAKPRPEPFFVRNSKLDIFVRHCSRVVTGNACSTLVVTARVVRRFHGYRASTAGLRRPRPPAGPDVSTDEPLPGCWNRGPAPILLIDICRKATIDP